MQNDYRHRFEAILNAIKSRTILEYARFKGSTTDFSRRRKMPVDDVTISILGRKGLAAAMEIRDYMKEKGNEINVSKQAYLKQRLKLNPEVFIRLNKQYLLEFYRGTDEEDLFRGYSVLAVDGSKAEIPASAENTKRFGCVGTPGNRVARALVSCISDVCNGFVLDMQVDGVRASESDMAEENIRRAREITGDVPLIVLFDRGYPSIRLVDFMEREGIRYLFRLSSNDYKAERASMRSSDETVILAHTGARLAKTSKKHPEEATRLREKGQTSTRITVNTNEAGKEIVFMSNLPEDEFTGTEVAELYLKRWEIEKKYNTLKNKLRFESVTGEATLYVYQDFWAQILVCNMVTDMLRSADEELAEEQERKRYKHRIHANENMAMGLFKREMIGLMTEPDAEARGVLMEKLQKSMESYVLPYRNSKSHERIFKKSNKNKRNLKRTF
jgi:IS4 transposase